MKKRFSWTTPVDVALYQAGWLACVAAAAHDAVWAGVLIASALTAARLGLSDRPGPELRLVLSGAALGVAIDGALAAAGVVTYTSGQPAAWLPPLWILCLWMLFATLFSRALAWLRGRYVLAAVLGALGGPPAYLAGERLGAIEVPNTALALLTLALAWALATPLLTRLSERLMEVERAEITAF